MKRYKEPKTFAMWSKDEEIRKTSTSGGAFTEFAKIIFEKGGVVFGAAYTKDNMVAHDVAESIEDLPKLRQSKYISSLMGNIYMDVKARLENGELVGFCGAPCQVAGLYAFLGKEYDNLFVMDFICRGTNSPKALKAWLAEIEEKEKSKVKRVWFKYKDGGWKTSPRRTRLDFEDGHYVVSEDENNLFMHGYLTSNLYIRPACGNCRFKGVPRKSDVTLADFWGIEKELDDDKGTSLVLINSDKGMEYYEKAKESLNAFERKFEEIFEGNVCFENSVEVPKESEMFLKDLDNMKFSEAIKKYTKKSFGKRLKGKASRIGKKLLNR